jgi:hypothetical protein
MHLWSFIEEQLIAEIFGKRVSRISSIFIQRPSKVSFSVEIGSLTDAI